MGREVRMVPADWQHPKDDRGRYKPMYDGSFAKDAAEWDVENAKWAEGLRKDYSDEFDGSGWKPREKDDGMTATYEQWLPICQGGFAPSMVLDSKGLRSGVEAADDINAKPDAE